MEMKGGDEGWRVWVGGMEGGRWRVEGVEVEGGEGGEGGGWRLEKMNNGWWMEGWGVCKVKGV